MSRLERFRKYVAAMDPTVLIDVRTGALVHSDPRASIIDAICTPLELAPSRRILVVGCTGSGKTTLVQRCVQRIRKAVKDAGDHARYIDVSRHHRLDEESLEGVLVALAGESLVQAAGRPSKGDSPEFQEAAKHVKRHARGYSEWVQWTNDDEDPPWYDQEDDQEPGRVVSHRGVLKPPKDSVDPARLKHMVEPLKELRRHLTPATANALFAFDSLDRLSNPSRFKDAVQHDLPVLAAAGIGTIVVGPVRYSLGNDRSIHNLFDSVHVVPTVDTRDVKGREFLSAILRIRDDEGVLPDGVLPQIVEASGGVLRDLISLAQRAGEEAYSRGHDPVEENDVHAAISALGDSLAFGIDDAALRVLRALDERDEFVIRGESELALVDQRRVLNVGIGEWQVHPALLPKLRAIPVEAA